MAIMQRTFKSWRRPWWRWRALADRRDRISAPGMFDAVDWSVSDPSTSGDIVISVDALPSSGGADITDIEYDVDGDNAKGDSMVWFTKSLTSVPVWWRHGERSSFLSTSRRCIGGASGGSSNDWGLAA